MSRTRQGTLLASCVAVTQAALAAMSASRRGDLATTRREVRGVALALARAARLVGEIELAAVIERSLYVSAGLGR